jgi:hypothetical protein
MALSSGACEFLLFLKDRLKRLERQLARALFFTLWQSLAQALNKLIYTQVITYAKTLSGKIPRASVVKGILGFAAFFTTTTTNKKGFF